MPQQKASELQATKCNMILTLHIKHNQFSYYFAVILKTSAHKNLFDNFANNPLPSTFNFLLKLLVALQNHDGSSYGEMAVVTLLQQLLRNCECILYK